MTRLELHSVKVHAGPVSELNRRSVSEGCERTRAQQEALFQAGGTVVMKLYLHNWI